MPVLEDEGWVLWESNAILFYLAAKRPEIQLWPKDVRAQAEVLRWLFWEAAHWVPACGPLIAERIKKSAFGRGAPDQKVIAEAEIVTREHARILDDHLQTHAWLAGERVTIADFSLASWFIATKLAQFPIAEFEAIKRWYSNVRALRGWKEAIPHPVYPPDIDVWW
jgi:glutathione S-transferase